MTDLAPATAAQRADDGRTGRFARDALIALATVAVGHATGAVGGVLSARLLGPEGKGISTVLFLGGILLGAMATLGVDLWTTKSVARSGYQAAVVGVVRRHLVVATLGMAAVGAVAAPAILAVADRIDGPSYVAAVALAVSSIWFVLGHAFARGRRDLRRWLGATGISGGTYLAVVGVLLFVDRPSVALVVAAAAIGRVLSLVTVPWRELPLDGTAPWSRWLPVVRSHASASLGTLVEVAAYRFDLLLIAWFVTAEEIGLYAAALPLAELLWLVPNALAQVLLPSTAATPSADVTARTIRIALLVSAVPAIVLALAAAPIVVVVFGETYRAAADAVPLLVLASVVLTVWKLTSADLLARGHSAIRATTGLLGLATMLVALAGLAPAHGIVGAAAASLIGYSVSTTTVLVIWRTHTDGSLRDLVPGRRDDLVTLRSAVTAMRIRREGDRP